MKLLDNWGDWLGSKPWYIQILIGLFITIPLLLLLLAIPLIMVRVGWGFLWNIIKPIFGILILVFILGFLVWSIIRIIKAIKTK
jgi:hypothetical protein